MQEKVRWFFGINAHVVARVGMMETAVKGIYLRSERMEEIYRGDAENETKWRKKCKNTCAIQKKAVILHRKMCDNKNKLT